ncbi:disintegrin and metalloproteinase domain-containing protein 2-like isoform X8 [Podarcis muralis]
MALLGLLLALLSVCLVSALGSQRTFLQVTVPQRIPSYVTGNTERMTFDIDINGKPYIIHLKQQSFLTNDFRVYTYSHGGSAVSFVPPIQRNCYYQGYIEGYTDSIVMLSTCLGLSGLLQFENSSYGIEPVESASGFQHLVYQIEYEDAERPLSEQNYSIRWSSGITPRVESGIPVNFSTTRYVEMHIVVAKGLYDYMGSDEDVVMKKITQLISFINTMFYKLNMKIILSSMEFWKDRDKISTTGTANELLEKFVDWKLVHLALRPHDVAFLFVYRNRGDSVGSTFARKMCHRPSSAAIAMECESNPCCEPNCLLRRGKACAHGDCCWSRYCRLKAKGTLCRGTKDEYCDLKEYCNGTSAECTENFYVQDGQNCEGETGICMEGTCQSADLWCRKVFGKDSKSGSSQCYEEINSQKDRMGHCGSSAKGYENCQWQDLKCGKLVCEYPGKKPYAIENAAIIYAKVQNRLCVTLDYMKGPGVKDPFLVRDGSICGDNKVCMTQKCVDRSILKTTCDPVKKCNRKGVCNNKGNCHCNMGWAPPDCTMEDRGGLGGSIDSTFRSAATVDETLNVGTATRNWLLISFFLFLPVLIGSVILIIKLRDFFSNVKGEEEEEEDAEEEEEEGKGYDTKRSQQVHQPQTARPFPDR